MTHARAQEIVERLTLVGPAHGTVHGDFDRVKAALDEQPELVKALNALDPSRVEETPQGAAAHLGCREILACMLSRGVRLDIFMACALGMAERAAEFLRQEPTLANARGAHGIHVLNHAADQRTAQLLLDLGADPNAVIYAPWGWTPVHEAAAKGRREIVALLVTRGGEIGRQSQGTSPLHAAARNGHRAVVAWLLDRGAAPNARGRGGPWDGKTALDFAVEYGHDDIAALLRRQGVCGGGDE